MEEFSKVRTIINLFESHQKESTLSKPLNKNLSKSFSSLSYAEKNIVSDFYQNDTNLDELERRLASYILKTEMYKNYTKEAHIIFQNELVDILIEIANIDIKSSQNKKKQLITFIQTLFDELNLKLPEFSKNNSDLDFTYKPFHTIRKRPVTIGGTPDSDTSYRMIQDKSNRNSFPSYKTNNVPSRLGGNQNSLPFSNTRRSPLVVESDKNCKTNKFFQKESTDEVLLLGEKQDVTSPLLKILNQTKIEEQENVDDDLIGGHENFLRHQENLVTNETSNIQIGSSLNSLPPSKEGKTRFIQRSPSVIEISNIINEKEDYETSSTAIIQKEYDCFGGVKALKNFFEGKTSSEIKTNDTVDKSSINKNTYDFQQFDTSQMYSNEEDISSEDTSSDYEEDENEDTY